MLVKADSSFPEYLNVETTNKCNLKCIMCPRDTMTRAEGTMDMELYRKIVEDCSNHVEHIKVFSLFMDGEPLLDDLLEERIRIAKDAGIRFTDIATNGMLLTRARARSLVESGLDSITVSLEDIDKDAHEQIRRGAQYDKIISNLENLISIRDRASSTTPQITVRMLGFEENTARRKAFVEHWKTKADQVIIQPLHNWGGSAAFGGEKTGPKLKCDYLWKQMVILVDGTVALCCLDYDGVHRLGNARHESIYDIWHGAKFREYRQKFENSQIDMCNNCNWIPGSEIMHVAGDKAADSEGNSDEESAGKAGLEWTGERYLPWIGGAQIHYEHLHRYAFATHFVKGKKVLDLACGEGYGTYMLAREAEYVAGVEIDKPTVQHARSRYIKDNLEFIEGSILAVPIEGERKFDVAVCFEGIEHVAEHDKLLSEVKRLLKDDGLFIVSTPNKATYTDAPSYHNPFHVKELYFDEFSSLLRRYFKDLRMWGQRVYAGSNIWSVVPNESRGYMEVVVKKGDEEFYFAERHSKAPVYFIAVASSARLEPLLPSVDSWLVDASNVFFNDYERRLAELNHTLETKGAQISSLETSLQEKVSQISSLEANLQEKASRIASLETSLQEKASQVANLETSLQEKASQVANLETSLHDKAAQISSLETSLQEKTSQVANLEAQMQDIQRGIVVQLMNRYQRIVEKLLRRGTRRRHCYELVLTGIRVVLNEGWKSFFRRVKAYLRGEAQIPKKHLLIGTKTRYYYQLGLTAIRIIRNEGWRSFWTRYRIWLTQRRAERKRAKVPPLTPDMADDWGDYWVLSRRIAEDNRRRLETVHPRVPEMVSIDEKDLVARAGSLTFPAVDKPQVSIIIPVYNNAKLTVECLTSLLTHTRDTSYEIIIVDDGSTQETRDLLSQIRGITYLQNPSNLGFLLSCNRGAEQARGEFLLIFNNDVQVTKGWLSSLVETFSRYDNVGAVGPKILYPNGRLQEAGTRIKQDAYSQLIGLWDDPQLPRYNYTREVEYCSGACLMVETEVFRKLGGLDKDFAPGYCEDSDLCFRIRKLGKRVLYNPNSVIVHHLSATVKVDSPHKKQLAIRNAQKLAEKRQEQIDASNRVRLIAFYLPQYHTIPENDRWWGKGFTEWTNVKKAQPNFDGHYQPHVPGDLGFYDLNDEKVMEKQAEMAKRYGIYGFCYFYYWFAGKRLLEMPLERMLKTGKPDIPFCLSWANENWTRRWDGRDDLVLMAQQHSDEDDRAVIRDIMRYMRHPNYIRVNGRPLLLVYRVSLFPNIKRTTEIWRDQCLKEGIGDIYLAMCESFEHAVENVPPSKYGFDASVEYPPHQMAAPIKPPGKTLNPHYKGVVSDYREMVLRYLQKEIPGYTRFRTVMPGWDNTPRRQHDSYIFAHASPGAYQAWLEAIIEQTLEQNYGDERIVFINAWNEWAEGNHLEPDQRFGHGFLEATRNALERTLLKATVHGEV